MNTIKISATAARNKFFQLLDEVAAGKTIIIEKDKKEIAIITPKETKTDWKALKKAVKESKGILKNYTPEEIAPAKYKGKWEQVGTWDKDFLHDK